MSLGISGTLVVLVFLNLNGKKEGVLKITHYSIILEKTKSVIFVSKRFQDVELLLLSVIFLKREKEVLKRPHFNEFFE